MFRLLSFSLFLTIAFIPPGCGPMDPDASPDPSRGSGKADMPDFVTPEADLHIPSYAELGHPPTSNDVTVNAGFDKRTPEEVVALVRQQLQNDVHPSNESFINRTITATHQRFTIAVWNFFVSGSPTAKMWDGWKDYSLAVLGTVSAIHPKIIQVSDKATNLTIFVGQTEQGYINLTKNPYPVIMKAELRKDPPGVRISYPTWSAAVLENPTCTIIEPP